jgi:hypothetical protein
MAAAACSGCRSTGESLLPSSYEIAVSNFTTYAEALSAFKNVKPYKTTCQELHALGFDTGQENVQLLNYVEIQQWFLSNPAITMDDLADGVRDCLEAKDGCTAYKIRIEQFDEERFGNFFLDLMEFRKRTRTTGWRFEALFIVVDEVIIYKLHSGQPNISRERVEKKPLGPLNDVEGRDVYRIFY